MSIIRSSAATGLAGIILLSAACGGMNSPSSSPTLERTVSVSPSPTADHTPTPTATYTPTPAKSPTPAHYFNQVSEPNSLAVDAFTDAVSCVTGVSVSVEDYKGRPVLVYRGVPAGEPFRFPFGSGTLKFSNPTPVGFSAGYVLSDGSWAQIEFAGVLDASATSPNRGDIIGSFNGDTMWYGNVQQFTDSNGLIVYSESPTASNLSIPSYAGCLK